MRLHRTIIFITILLWSFNLSAHSGKARYHAIIETNGNPNDLRTISLCLASKDIEVIGIYCTKEEFEIKNVDSLVGSLLSEYHHEGVPLGSTTEFLKQVYQSEEEAITYICLSSLRSLAAEVCINPDMIAKTEFVIWYTHETIEGVGFNQQTFPEGYSKIRDCGLPLIHLSDGYGRIATLDKKFLKNADKIESRYTTQLDDVYNSTGVSEELAAIYLYDPALFEDMESSAFPGNKVYCPISPTAVEDAYLELLHEKDPDYKILSQIPLEEEYYQDDLAPHIESIYKAHGESEWRAGVLCFELHGHIGIFAIIGVKMGLRAREYYNIGLDDLSIVSHAGQVPPFSCLNDGLQVSTGSSLGHGLIRAPETEVPQISAAFNFKEMEVIISLKPGIVSRIQKDIKNCIDEHGKLTPAYWKEVRELALEYWLELDRNKIFTINNSQ